MKSHPKPRIGLLAGDPSGIGPEVAARLLADPAAMDLAEPVLIGDAGVFYQGTHTAGVSPDLISARELLSVPLTETAPVAQVTSVAGAFTLATLRAAVEAFRAGQIDALVFAPLNKQAMKVAGLTQEDEMHYLASLLAFKGLCSEINAADKLWTTRVTSHVPLRAVADLITHTGVCAASRLLATLMGANLGRPARLAVAGLNPHAGEGGLMGTEEVEIIAPAVKHLRAEGLDVTGPLPADTLFIAARRGDFDGVVTMYHDQGQIATKLLGFEKGVTIHAGLPMITTTPAHGTAFDIAGQGLANPGPILAAWALAARLVRNGTPGAA
jgi:4-hydroxythreonine-4-phosphate dehydrogenase